MNEGEAEIEVCAIARSSLWRENRFVRRGLALVGCALLLAAGAARTSPAGERQPFQISNSPTGAVAYEVRQGDLGWIEAEDLATRAWWRLTSPGPAGASR